MRSDYRTLLQLLQRELKQQERLLELLTKERVAVVKLKQDDILKLAEAKESILGEAKALEQSRATVILELSGSDQPIKLRELLGSCKELSLKRDLERVGGELRKTTEATRELHQTNSILLKQAMGIVATTTAILRSAPDTGLPSYGEGGKMKDKNGASRPGVSRSA